MIRKDAKINKDKDDKAAEKERTPIPVFRLTNEAASRIYRGSLEIMLEKATENTAATDTEKIQELSSTLMSLYPTVELKSQLDEAKKANKTQDPVKAQIRLVATQWALEVLQKTPKYREVWYAGDIIRTPAELKMLGEIAKKIKDADDPQDVEDYLDDLEERNAVDSQGKKLESKTSQQQNTLDPQVQKMLGQFLETRDIFIDRIKRNDQTVPSELLLTGEALWVAKRLGAGALLLLAKAIWRQGFLFLPAACFTEGLEKKTITQG